MAYAKKLVIHGFKSFPRKTEILFENAMNVIVGPNGSGKSNITDALCFVLGRTSMKSIRATKAANLIFSGSKKYKPAHSAEVELIFDNSQRSFPIDKKEISIKRIVKRNGTSTYKINGETKTRNELLELLAQAGIDPYGFNIVLQGEIASLVNMNSEQRRKILEDVSGISVYETRKEKSLRELDKTEKRLDEINAVLREKMNYLKNLEKEREQVLNYKKLEETAKRCKATILSKTIKEKQNVVREIENKIETEKKLISKIRQKIAEKNKEIENLDENLRTINKKIQSSSGEEKNLLHEEIRELKSTHAGLKVKEENFQRRIEENSEKETNLKKRSVELIAELEQIKKPDLREKQSNLNKLQERFEELEKKKRRFYILKTEIQTLRNKKDEKNNTIIQIKKEIEIIENSISKIFDDLVHIKNPAHIEPKINEINSKLISIDEKIREIDEKILAIVKEDTINEQTISREEKLKGNIQNLDTCPLCRNQITKEHIKNVITRSESLIEKSKKNLDKNIELKRENSLTKERLQTELRNLQNILKEVEKEKLLIHNTDEKKERLKTISEERNETEKEIKEISKNIEDIEKEFASLKNIESEYDETRLKVQELSFADIDIDSETSIKKRELERIRVDLKTITRDNEESEQILKKISGELNSLNSKLEIKEKKETELYERFEKLNEKRNEIQDQVKATETTVMGWEHEVRNHEHLINEFNIDKAQKDAQLEGMEKDYEQYHDVELLNIPLPTLTERLQKTLFRLQGVGTINMKALEVYEGVRKSCESIQERVETLGKEKEKILEIITQIDKKKKKAFLTSLEKVNEYFTRNFSRLSRKGEVFLEIENKKDIFEGGLNILLKVGKGKYFEISSLSGGEKTLIALSLIFAIQEYKPYYFYIFDEIDAALDKHNSELLATLIKKYMVSGQYIIISHNDALITEATTLYGVSMQENISQVISQKIKE